MQGSGLYKGTQQATICVIKVAKDYGAYWVSIGFHKDTLRMLSESWILSSTY